MSKVLASKFFDANRAATEVLTELRERVRDLAARELCSLDSVWDVQLRNARASGVANLETWLVDKLSHDQEVLADLLGEVMVDLGYYLDTPFTAVLGVLALHEHRPLAWAALSLLK